MSSDRERRTFTEFMRDFVSGPDLGETGPLETRWGTLPSQPRLQAGVATPGIGGLGRWAGRAVGSARNILPSFGRSGAVPRSSGARLTWGRSGPSLSPARPPLTARQRAALGGAGVLGGAAALGRLGGRGGDEPDAAPAPFRTAEAGGGSQPSFADLVGPAPQVGGGGRGGLDDFARAEQVLGQQLGQLNQQFESAKADLQRQFRFAETPEEKARLAFILGDLEEQQRAGQVIVAQQFNQAQARAAGQAAAMREAAGTEGAAMGDLYRDSAGRAGAAVDAIASDYLGTGMGVGAQPVSGDAADWIGLLEAAAPREQALTERLGNIAADDIAALSAQLGGEGAAQQGALQRAALGIRADEIARHQQAVADRVNAERMAHANMLANLQSQFLGRQWGGQDRLTDLMLSRAGLLEGRRQDEQDWQRRQAAGYEQDRRDFELRRHFDGGAASAVPSDPQEQVLFVGELLARDPVNGRAIIDALVAQGAIDPAIVAFFLTPGQ